MRKTNKKRLPLKMSSALAITTASTAPAYEFRLALSFRGDYEYSIWRAPSPSSRGAGVAEQVGAVRGEAARTIENRILRQLARARIHFGPVPLGEKRKWGIEEDRALTLGLLFRVLAPMRSLERIREIAERVEEMSREEAGYWLGMSIYRQNPRRVLAALRLLLTTK
jgi:hypothetical protein